MTITKLQHHENFSRFHSKSANWADELAARRMRNRSEFILQNQEEGNIPVEFLFTSRQKFEASAIKLFRQLSPIGSAARYETRAIKMQIFLTT